MSLIFKDIKVIGLDNIPQDGALIICGNHSNLFVDPMMIISNSTRQVRWIIAKVTHQQKLAGWFSKNLKCIPIERPMDIARKGQGQVKFLSPTLIEGIDGANFIEQTKPGEFIFFGKQCSEQTIVQVISQTELKIKQPGVANFIQEKKYNYKIIPKIDQSKIYENIWNKLGEGECIGIFPEGASSDRTDLLPLKAGVSIMTLGAMLKNQGLKVQVITCGLKYFKPHKFRSQAIVQFGKPFEISEQLLESYKQSRREGISKLLQQISNKLRQVMLVAPSYKELQAILMARSLYLPPTDQKNSTTFQNNSFKQFEIFYNNYYQEEDVQQLFQSIKAYVKELKVLDITDKEVISIETLSKFSILFKLIRSLVLLIFTLSFTVFGFVLMAPLGLVLQYLAEKKRKHDLAHTQTRVTGVDVMTSKKILSAILLFPLQSFTFFVILLLIFKFYYGYSSVQTLLSSMLLITIWPFYCFFCLLSYDTVLRHYRMLRSRIIAIFYSKKVEYIQNYRKLLKQKISEIIKAKNIERILNLQQFEREEDYQIKSRKRKMTIQDWYESIQDADFDEVFKFFEV